MIEFTAGVDIRVPVVALWREVLAARDVGIPRRDCLPLALEALVRDGVAGITVRIAKQVEPEGIR